MILIIYANLLIVVGFYFLISTILNSYKTISDTCKDGIDEKDEPFVSVLIPARNEEANIKNCVNSFLHQTYKNYEILVLDDNSTDDTYKILKKLKKNNSDKLRIFKGKPLPFGWRGKSFAMKQLTSYAKGDIFLFTDADTVHSEKSIEMMVSNIVNNDFDLVSGYIFQKLKTFGEKITVPVMYSLTVAIPMWLNDKLKTSIFSTAIGQYIGVKKTSFEAIGGYDEIKNITTEDIYLARRMKDCGFKTAFLNFNEVASCRMYDGYRKSVEGVSKNVFDFAGKNNFVMFLFAFAVWAFLCVPFFSMFSEIVKYFLIGNAFPPYFSTLVFVNVAFFLSWTIIFSTRGLPLYYAFLYPLLFLNLLNVIIVSWVRGNSVGYVWKGRVVK